MLNSSDLLQAIGIYLELAYPNGIPPRIDELVNSLITSSDSVLKNPAFVRQDNGPYPSYTLRLGCSHYPHMKMQVAIWPAGPGYFLTVDGHDKHIVVSPDNPEYAAFEKLRHKNQRLIEAIELAWSDAGVPTFAFCFDQEVQRIGNDIGRLAA